MAIAISPQIPIPSISPDFHLPNLKQSSSAPSSAPTRSISSPGGTRKNVPAGQQFGRYQQDVNINAKTPSSLSLEALAAILNPNPDDHSPGIVNGRELANVPFRKSQSFPLLKPTAQSYSPHKSKRPPVRKARSVKFADTEGRPLASIRKLTAADPFETEGEIVPKLISDLGAISLSRSIITSPATSSGEFEIPKPITRKPTFVQPGTQPDFFTKLTHQYISLESVSTSQPRAIHGVVRVMNIAYDKEVVIRWTHDRWQTHHDSKCTYCHGSTETVTDRFSFTLPANGDDVEFAVCYRVNGQEYWDSRNGQNYLITVDR